MRALHGAITVLASAAIAYAELRAALVAAYRDRRLSPRRLANAKAALETLWSGTSPLWIDADLIREAGDLAEALALRGYDAVHLAAARRLGPPGVVDAVACWDADLRAAAVHLGHRVIPA